jgi:DNA-binding NarL/FixJ family response regulator
MTTTTMRPPLLGLTGSSASPARTSSARPRLVPLHPEPASSRIRVAVQAGDPLTTAGLGALLRECPDLLAVSDGDAHGAHVAVVVIDQVTHARLTALRDLAARPGVRLVLIVGDLSTEGVALALNAGAVGVLRRRDVTREALGQLVRSVAAGDAVVPPDLLSALLPHRREPDAVAAPAPAGVGTVPRMLALAGLNEREIDVLRMLADGSDTREIAQRLCYSERTVKTIIQDITRRFGLRNRSHAVAYAVRHGVI